MYHQHWPAKKGQEKDRKEKMNYTNKKSGLSTERSKK